MINKNITSVFLIFLFQINIVLSAQSKEQSPDFQPDKTEYGFFEKLETLKEKAISETSGLKKLGAPRVVPKGGKPEIIIVKDKIYFDGKKLWIGAPLKVWKKALSGHPRCSKQGITICVWEQYGLQLGTDESIYAKVEFLNIYLSFSDEDGRDLGKKNYPKGKENLASDDWEVHEVFSGYLELDGYGMDAKSKFWEIRSGTKTTTNLKCGIRECSSPRGAFGDHGEIQLSLNGNSESSTLRQFSISRTDKE